MEQPPTSPTDNTNSMQQFTPQQWQTIRDLIQYEVSIASSTNKAASNPLSLLEPSTIACRRCHLEFPSKSQLFKHVQARPRCTRIKLVVSLISPRAYPQHDASHAPPQSGTSFGGYGYAGGYGYNTISYASSSSGNGYEQKLELHPQHEGEHVEAPHQKKQHVFGHVQKKDVEHYNQLYQDSVVKQDCENHQEWQDHGNTGDIDHGCNNDDYGYEDKDYNDDCYDVD